MGFQTDRGLNISILPISLHIAKQEWFNANRILKSVLQSGTGNNDVNVLKMTNAFPGGIKMNHYFQAPHAWFVRTNCPNGMNMFWRDKPMFDTDNEFDTKNAKAATYFRCSFGQTIRGSASNLVFVAKSGSVATSIVIPTSAYALANATDVDLAFYVNRKQDIDIFVGSQLVGWLPQSGTGVQTPPGPPYVAGAVAALRQAITPTTLTSAVLNPTLAIQSGTASSKTMNADFFMASKER
ncbi:unnamed protein product [Sphagnum balticum]